MSIETIEETRIHVRIRGPMAEHIQNVIGPHGIYESQSEYIRDLIRHDMGQIEDSRLQASVKRSLKDVESGHYRKLNRKRSLQEAQTYAKARDKNEKTPPSS